MLVRAENRNKFEGRWFGPYRIDKKMLLGTYRLADPQGNIVKMLINGQRLVSAHVTDQTAADFWNSSQIQGQLRKQNIQITKSAPEVAELFEKQGMNTPSYDELATIPFREWKRLQRAGARSFQVGEEMAQPLSEPDAVNHDTPEQDVGGQKTSQEVVSPPVAKESDVVLDTEGEDVPLPFMPEPTRESEEERPDISIYNPLPKPLTEEKDPDGDVII